MRLSTAAAAAFASAVLAAPATGNQSRQNTEACGAPVKLDAKTNVFSTLKLHANSVYRGKVEAAAASLTDKSLAAAAKKVADIPTFLWM